MSTTRLRARTAALLAFVTMGCSPKPQPPPPQTPPPAAPVPAPPVAPAAPPTAQAPAAGSPEDVATAFVSAIAKRDDIAARAHLAGAAECVAMARKSGAPAEPGANAACEAELQETAEFGIAEYKRLVPPGFVVAEVGAQPDSPLPGITTVTVKPTDSNHNQVFVLVQKLGARHVVVIARRRE